MKTFITRSSKIRAIVTLVLITFLVGGFFLTACEEAGPSAAILPSAVPANLGLEQLPTATPTVTPTPQPKERITIGERNLLNGDYDAALDEFWTARSESTDPEVIAKAQLGVGRVLLMKSDFSGAIDQLTWLLSNFPDGDTRNTAYFFLARAFEGLQEYLLAAEAYGNYVEALPGPLDCDILEMQGDAFLLAGDIAAARNAFLQALDTVSAANLEPLTIKLAQASADAGNDNDAITRYLALYESSSSDYIKAQVNLLLGRIYLRLGLPEQAYARFQDSVIQFPTYYDTYSGMIALLEAGQPVDLLLQGIVYYYAGKYGAAITALDGHMALFPGHEGTAHYYKALSFWQLGYYNDEIAEWDLLINDHPTDPFFAKAYLERASTQWRYLEDFLGAADTLQRFVARIPDAEEAPEYLYTAGSIYEIGGYLTKAAQTWQRVFTEYPGADNSYPALFKAGIITYRLGKFSDAQIIFQRLLVLATTDEDLAAANFWTAKCLEQLEKPSEAVTYYQQAANADPTGYYSIRAAEKLAGENPFPAAENLDFTVNLEADKKAADSWMRDIFQLDASEELSGPGELSENPLFQRALTFWTLDQRDRARAEFENLREELQGDAVNSYRLINTLVETGFYQSAALSSRRVLDLAGMSQAATLTNAPTYFNHIRFGTFYRDLVVPAAIENDLDPLLLFSVIRQESLFDASITSSAGAHGLMQITNDTGDYIVSNFGWPPGYKTSDLDRPFINIRMGAHYLNYWIDRYNGSIPAALSSYNAGDGNNIVWMSLAGDDTDLLLEIIRFNETREYIKYIAETYAIYKSIYTHP